MGHKFFVRKRLKIRLREKKIEAVFPRPVFQGLHQFARHESEQLTAWFLKDL